VHVGAVCAPGCPIRQMASYLLVLLLYTYTHGVGAECRAFTTCGCGDRGYKEGKAFCDFEEADGGCAPCSDYKKAKHCSTDGLPSAGEADCVACCFATPAPTATPAPSAVPTTSAPSVSPAPTVTHVPTRGPSGLNPEVASTLLTLLIAPASVAASASSLACCHNAQGRRRLGAAAATVPHVVAIAAWTCWVTYVLGKYACSGCSMGSPLLSLMWLLSAGAAFAALCTTGWLVCNHPAEDEPPPTHDPAGVFAVGVTVVVPPGAVAGQTLSVACPELPPGRQMVTFVVPECEAGATVQIPVGGPPVVSAAKDTA
jgi:hypothetical protein